MPDSLSPKTPAPILRPKMPELDSLRGVACLLVLFFHGFGNHYAANGLPFLERGFISATGYGWTGVNLFFVLSGFLITGILLDSKDTPRYYARFYYRRALRILPAYYGILLVVIFFTRTGMVDRPVSWSFLGLSAIYLANSVRLFGVQTDYGVLWSLAVEEHFYLLWPFCVQKLRRGGLTILAILICVLALGCRIVAFWLGSNALGPYTWMVADGLAMGALLAIAARNFAQNRSAFRLIAVGAFVVSLLGYFADRLAGHPLFGGAIHITSFNSFYAGMVASILLLGSRFSIRNRLLEFVGEISYGLYLIHVLCFDLYDHYSARFWPSWQGREGNFGLIMLRFLVSAALAIAIAFLSRRYFEEPFLRLKDRLSQTGHSSFRRREMDAQGSHE